ncbi:hypothetical protein ACFL2H_09530 [Planctomycetota bacterium]
MAPPLLSLYAHGNPVMGIDPTGLAELNGSSLTSTISIGAQSRAAHGWFPLWWSGLLAASD